MQPHDDLETAYRTTFREYASRLDALQGFMDSGVLDDGRIETVLFAVEKARVAHNCARDRLADELTYQELPRESGAAHEGRVRETARLLWELAGRPAGTAERDWSRAEQLVQSAIAADGKVF